MLSASCHPKLGMRAKKDEAGRRKWKKRGGQATSRLETCSLM